MAAVIFSGGGSSGSSLDRLNLRVAGRESADAIPI